MLTLRRPSALRSTVLGALALLALRPAADKLEFRAASGAEVPRTYVIGGNMELGDMTMLVNGQDMGGMIPLDQISGEGEMTMKIVDRYLKVEGGKILEFEREFVESNAEWDMGEESGSEEDVSELDGKTVVYKWNSETSAYDVSYKDGEGDEDKLAGAGKNPEMFDSQLMLPKRAVEKGERWSVDSKDVAKAMFDFDLEDLASMGGEVDDPMAMAFIEQLKPSLQTMLENFKLECEYDGTRDEDGVNVGVIKLTMTGEGTMDLAQFIEEIARQQIPPEVQVEMTFNTAQVTLNMTGEGELLWNLEKGLAHAFTMDADAELTFELDASVSAEGQEQAIEMNMELLGKVRQSMN